MGFKLFFRESFMVVGLVIFYSSSIFGQIKCFFQVSSESAGRSELKKVGQVAKVRKAAAATNRTIRTDLVVARKKDPLKDP